MWFGGLPGDSAGSPVRRADAVRREDVAKLRYEPRKIDAHISVFLTKRIGIDRLLQLFMLHSECLMPHMLKYGLKKKP